MVLSVGLTLAETLVKNCHDPVYREIASERFMAAVAKIARVRVSNFVTQPDHNQKARVFVCA